MTAVEGQRPRRRRGRRPRRGPPESPDTAPSPATAGGRSGWLRRLYGPEPWQWLTFPVFFAFVFGAFLMILIIDPKESVADSAYYPLLFFGLLLAVVFGIIHMLARWLVTRGRGRE